jgi:hypothetical protein
VLWRARVGVHARPGVPGPAWARLGLGRADLSLANGWHEQVQGSKGSLQDMMEVRGEGRGEGWHGEWPSGWHDHAIENVVKGEGEAGAGTGDGRCEGAPGQQGWSALDLVQGEIEVWAQSWLVHTRCL